MAIAVAMARAITFPRHPLALFLSSRRSFFLGPTTRGLSRLVSPVRVATAATAVGRGMARLGSVRCRVNQAGPYSPLGSGPGGSDRPPTEMAPLFPGCDYEHWLIVMDKPGGEGATKQQMIDCYI